MHSQARGSNSHDRMAATTAGTGRRRHVGVSATDLLSSPPRPLRPNKRKAPQLSAGETLSTRWSPCLGLLLWGSSWESCKRSLGAPPADRPPTALRSSKSLSPGLAWITTQVPGASGQPWEGKSKGVYYSLSPPWQWYSWGTGLGTEPWNRGPPSE